MAELSEHSAKRIGIIGGTGVYDPSLLKNCETIKISTPYGSPSDLITIGNFMGKKIAFIPRHSSKHTINPSMVNYRANIFALKEVGVGRIISITAVGSLKEEIKPGDFVFTDQFADFTKFRKNTFYEGQRVAHISIPKPFCEEIRNVIIKTAKSLNYSFHERGTCVVIEGPRFSTIAESEMFRKLGFDTINMTMVPEVILARELGMCYANISMVTDYDVWKEHYVNQIEVSRIMSQNVECVKNLLKQIIPKIDYKGKCSCKKAAEIMFL
jgi:5'-methylthioadenosine phosphorylase